LPDFGIHVAPHFRVHEIFYRAQFLRGNRFEVRKIETQPVRRNQRTLLRHVVAEHLAQSRVQQMRRRVVEHDRLAPRSID
jgi:hypothetical protein